MEYIPWISLAAIVGLAIGGAISYWLIRRQDRLNLNSAQNQAKEVVAQAQKTADNTVKDAELKARDEFFKRREEFNQEFEKAKNEQREQERRLQKREDGLEQSLQAQLKKERILQHGERKLHERRELLEKKFKDVEAQVAEQTQKLHELSGLTREQAQTLLLERLDHELADEVAIRIHKHEESLKTITEETGPQGPVQRHPALRRRAHRRHHRQHASISPATT